MGGLLLESADRLARAGAELIICPDNTVHEAIDIVHARLPAPWVHIAEEVTQEARRRGFKRIGLLGTRFLMEGAPLGFGLRAILLGYPREDEVGEPDAQDGTHG